MIRTLKPACIWNNFYALTQVPRPSGHLEKIQQFLILWAKANDIEAYVDPAGNVVMSKPATPGMENRKPVILQAHMDMVPQKTKNSTHNFETDPIETHIEGDWVYANHTTLGSDDGMGVAAIMSVFESKDLKHGPLEALITADEETSMVGANGLPAGELHGEILLNLDTETEGEMIMGSAGGIDVTATMSYSPVNIEQYKKELVGLKIRVKGLKGGHSGLEICLGRANANKLLVRVIKDIVANHKAAISSWHCGNMRNAIPFDGEVILTIAPENVEAVIEAVGKWQNIFNHEFAGIENEVSVTCEEVDTPDSIVPSDVQNKLILAIFGCHNGVIRQIPSIPEIVETSSNLAIIDIEGGNAKIQILARSSSESHKAYIVETLSSPFILAGMNVETDGDYSGWDPNPDSAMIKIMREIYVREFGTEPSVSVCHAGLECSVILSKYPGLDIVSFGPTLESPHTAKERCQISTMPKFWTLLTKTLEEVPVKG